MRGSLGKLSTCFLVSVMTIAPGAAEIFKPPFPGHAGEVRTRTPIKHLVVIFGENESFDHYFGTYPLATNPYGEPGFHPLPYTPHVNGLDWELINNNPNKTNTANGDGASNPFRIDRAQAVTASQNHDYTPEQKAFDNGKMDLFPANTGRAGRFGSGTFSTTALVMGYFDGNTVTALWNYAQHFALNDNSYSSQFGPSTVGALNLVAGQTNGAVHYVSGVKSGADNDGVADDGQGGLTVMGDPDPHLDKCSGTDTVEMQGKNIGDLLNAKGISWGWFQGGFDLTLTNGGNTNYPYSPATTTGSGTGCARATASKTLIDAGVALQKDYVPHHAPFQYYPSTRNSAHTRPSVQPKLYGTSQDTGANHQYDTHDFFDALKAGHLPSVTYLKAPKFQNGHPGNSNPLDEQVFVVSVVNALQDSEFWESTAVVVAYDDSDGWYDHAHHVINPSFNSSVDALEATGQCKPLQGRFPALPVAFGDEHEHTPGFQTPLPGINGKPVNGRCGYGPRLPLLVISPWAKHNFVDHELTDQSSILRFIEDNWLDGERIGQGSYDAYAGSLLGMFDFNQLPYKRLKLDPITGLVQ
ncbi:phospholipase C [Bradyrhizobium sp. USDA 4369]